MHNMREAEGIGNNFIVLWPLRGHYTAGIRPARHKDRSHRGQNNSDIESCCPDLINNYESIVNSRDEFELEFSGSSKPEL